MEEMNLQELLFTLIEGQENEIVEFKDANDNYPTNDIGKYFSALANEANLRSSKQGWLILEQIIRLVKLLVQTIEGWKNA